MATKDNLEIQQVKEEINECELVTKLRYQPTHALHFQELNNIWDADKRIPTHGSRREWAEARNLNPRNVHAWWYRRRKLAKKLKINIPRDTYDLDVGVPPTIPPPEPIYVKEETPAPDDPVETTTTDPEPGFVSEVEMLSSDIGSELTHTSYSTTEVFLELATLMSKDAYMRSSSPGLDHFRSSTPTCVERPPPSLSQNDTLLLDDYWRFVGPTLSLPSEAEGDTPSSEIPSRTEDRNGTSQFCTRSLCKLISSRPNAR